MNCFIGYSFSTFFLETKLGYLLLRVSENGFLGIETIDRLFDIATSASEATTVYSTSSSSSSSSSSLFCPVIVDATFFRTVIMNHAVPLRSSTTSTQSNYIELRMSH